MLEEVGVFYRGLILGLVIAAPVGPVGLLCIRRTLQKGMLVGLATGLGAACADTLFGLLAVLGVSAYLGFIHHYEFSIRLVGACIVLATAWHTWYDHPEPAPQPQFVDDVLKLAPEKNEFMKFVRAALSGMIITMTNPLTVFGTIAVVATFGAVTGKVEADVLVSGLFMGSALWWFMLSGSVGLLRCHFTESRLVALNRVTAIMLATLAGWAFFSGIHGYMR